MASNRDQLQAYQFLVQRATSALVTGETDPEHPPFRRSAIASLTGVALAILALAGFGVYGLIVPGGNSAWRMDDVVIVEKETGTRYVNLNGRLHPVTNYVSALLLLGKHGSTVLVSRNSIVGVPRGPRIGIPDAPDALPAGNRLLSGSWSLCSVPASDVAGSRIEESVLLVGATPAGGRDLVDQALLVELVTTGERFLVWRGHRHRVDDYTAVGAGLALATESWARVGRSWLDVLPEGEPIGPIELARAGAPSTAVPGRADIRAGALLMVQTTGGGQQYYLAEADALRPITELQYDIQRAYSPTLAAYSGADPGAVPLAPSLAAAARQRSPGNADAGAAPATRPEMVRLRDKEATMCATFGPGDTAPRLSIDPALPPADPLTATARRSADGMPLADRVHVPPGWAAVIEAMPSPLAPVGTLTVVTDMGRRYPVATPEVLPMLGYSAVRPVRLPAGLVARLPEGPGLDPVAAREVHNE
ncbi:type VII secretion protein EccB [Dactylosporangium sp. AC04546]|uniref:type VII secretion protein EccB n=1 Tax=Dactylosporangium sp. AC04546 TaxID=2862460 RepID=UPI001EDD37A2|nr:type VII secretion protein EccB [Dactylosporangium sp. AC04546]WVK87318.1 type VII secretion protein EccB [Dactylosporangium sp. AC04546]